MENINNRIKTQRIKLICRYMNVTMITNIPYNLIQIYDSLLSVIGIKHSREIAPQEFDEIETSANRKTK